MFEQPTTSKDIGCIYRSTYSTIANDDKINELLRRASGLNFSHLLVFEDLDHPSINWHDNTSPPDGNDPASLFMESVRDAFLTQHVMNRHIIEETIRPTHWTCYLQMKRYVRTVEVPGASRK